MEGGGCRGTHHVDERADAPVRERADDGVLLEGAQPRGCVWPAGEAVPEEDERVPGGVVEVRREVLPAVAREHAVEEL